MRPVGLLLLFLLGLTSCVSPDDDHIRQALNTGMREMGEIAAASVQFRQLKGYWPAEPSDMQPLVTDPGLHLDIVQKTLKFQPSPRGLAFVDRRSGSTAFVVANESTPEHLVLLGGG